MSNDTRWAVGDKVVMRDVNERRNAGPRYGTVIKVGRKLVTVKDDGGWGEERVYRIDTGQANDKWGYASIQKPEEYADQQRRVAILSDLRERGIELRLGYGRGLSTDTLARVLAIVAGTETDGAA